MVVLSQDILASDPGTLLHTLIDMTIVRGEVVYDNRMPAAELTHAER